MLYQVIRLSSDMCLYVYLHVDTVRGWPVSTISTLPGTLWYSQVRRSFRKHCTTCNRTQRLCSIEKSPSFTPLSSLLFPSFCPPCPLVLCLSLPNIATPCKTLCVFSPWVIWKPKHTDTMTDLLLSFLPKIYYLFYLFRSIARTVDPFSSKSENAEKLSEWLFLSTSYTDGQKWPEPHENHHHETPLCRTPCFSWGFNKTYHKFGLEKNTMNLRLN